MPLSYQSPILDHRGLVAGLCEALGLGDIIAHTMPQDMTQRTVSRGHAVNAMLLNGLGFVHQPLYLVPSFLPQTPTERLGGPGIAAADRPEEVRGRRVEALDADGVTPLDRLMAARSPLSTRPVFTSMAALTGQRRPTTASCLSPTARVGISARTSSK